MRRCVQLLPWLWSVVLSGQTSLEYSRDSAVYLTHSTERLQYYQVLASTDLETWINAQMPEFLGMGEEVSVPLGYPTALLQDKGIFFRVDKGGTLEEFDPLNHGPIAIRRYVPQFPLDLLQEQIGGLVKISFIIDVDGSVYDLNILESTDERFSQEVLKVVPFWEFLPLTVNGERKASRATQWIPFWIR